MSLFLVPVTLPFASKRPCTFPGCSELTDSGRCKRHAIAVRRESDARRPTAAERGYDSHWAKARKHYLAAHPLCVMCEQRGRLTPATVVDHIIAHKGDKSRFWDSDNWRSLCAPCHNARTAREDGGFGNPVKRAP